MGLLSWLAEQKIAEAMARGEFDDLPGKGKPLKVEDLSGVPEDLRMAYKLMKNAGYVPEEIQLQQEMVRLADLLAACEEGPEKQALKKQLSEQRLRLNLLADERGLLTNPAFRQYEEAIRRKLE
ncbi:DnaJ family domain-containing protein [Paenibacillus sp. FSL R7-0216]|uniref:DnaJ family domain-containing protein n=1 Tax=Paenibacillus sp. FSL R7-0216 TaxID=2921677 RepID=UPI0030D74A20